MCGWVNVVPHRAFNVVVLMRVSVPDINYHMATLMVYTKSRCVKMYQFWDLLCTVFFFFVFCNVAFFRLQQKEDLEIATQCLHGI